MHLYRYVDYSDGQETFIRLIVYRVVRQTECTVLIEPVDQYEQGNWPKRVLKIDPDKMGKRFAYPTIAQAWQSWRIRKWRQLGHTRAAYARAKKINDWIAADPGRAAPVPLPRASTQPHSAQWWHDFSIRIGD
jgi:hypothetical protein